MRSHHDILDVLEAWKYDFVVFMAIMVAELKTVSVYAWYRHVNYVITCRHDITDMNTWRQDSDNSSYLLRDFISPQKPKFPRKNTQNTKNS